MIKVKNLIVHYDEFCAVNDISFHVKPGSLFALLGTNGAGKSTTIHVLCQLKEKTSGKIEYLGSELLLDDKRYKNSLAVVFQNSVLDKFLTVRENLLVRGSMYNISKEKLKENIELFATKLQMNDILDKRFGQLSGGQKRKADIAKALITEPRFLILDEPTTGLDPQTRNLVWEVLLYAKKERGLTILLTTHYMEETNHADYVVIMHNSKILAEGSPNELKDKHAYDILKLYYLPHHKQTLKDWFEERNIVYIEENNQLELHMKFHSDIYTWLTQIQDYIKDFELIKGDMDTVFLHVTGEDKTEDNIWEFHYKAFGH